MGPFYWAMAELHVPAVGGPAPVDGGLLFAAGAGALYLCRTIGLTGPGRLRGGPGVHVHALRAPVRRADLGDPHAVGGPALDGGLRHPGPARGGLAVPGPVRPGGGPGQRHQRQLHPLRGHRPGPVAALRRGGGQGGRRGAGPGAWPGRSACSSALVSLWWAVGLQVEAAYGVNVLKYTETVPSTSAASLASEILRGPRLLVLLRHRPGRARGPRPRSPTPRTCG